MAISPLTDVPPGRVADVSFGAAALVLQSALWLAVQRLASTLGPEAGMQWLADIREQAIREAKENVPEGIPTAVEAAELQYGVNLLEACFDVYRSRLTTRGHVS